jgi:hypothetical protein
MTKQRGATCKRCPARSKPRTAVLTHSECVCLIHLHGGCTVFTLVIHPLLSAAANHCCENHAKGATLECICIDTCACAGKEISVPRIH